MTLPQVPSDFLHAREAEPEPELKDLKLRPETAEKAGNNEENKGNQNKIQSKRTNDAQRSQRGG
jgi:hypothetical protein